MLDEGRTFAPTPSTTKSYSKILATPKPAKATKRQATAQVREKNKHEWICKFDFVGNTKLIASSTYMVTGCGVYDGKYYIDEISHIMSGDGGYTVSGTAHRVLAGY